MRDYYPPMYSARQSLSPIAPYLVSNRSKAGMFRHLAPFRSELTFFSALKLISRSHPEKK